MHAPDATAEQAGPNRVKIGDTVCTTDEARRLGFVPTRTDVWVTEYVQANAFLVRGIIRRGDAQKFDAGELREHVRVWLAERGVEFEPPDAFEAFCFNYSTGGSIPARVA